MSCFRKKTEEEAAGKKASEVIEKQIKEDRLKGTGEIKLLLLGTGSSGKSTFLKQLKALHKDGLSNAEVQQFKESLPLNALQSMQKLVEAAQERQAKPSSQSTKTKMDKLMSADELTEEIAGIITALWAREDLKDLFDRRADIGLSLEAAAPYYFENAPRFADEDFVPTHEDMLRARTKTTGIRELRFTINKRDFVIVDVGGQRSERRKWIHCFDNVNGVIYLAALDEYDMKLEEDNRTNRLEESLQLFGEVSGSQFFTDKGIHWILALNKVDLFEKKIAAHPLSSFFSDYPSDKDRSMREAVKYIQKKYETKYRGEDQLYCYTTCALDPKSCQKLFEAVQELIVAVAIKQMSTL